MSSISSISSMPILYEIKITSKYNLSLLHYYEALFYVVFNGLNYEVWYHFGIIKLRCRVLNSLYEAKVYLSRAMKMATQNRFLYRICPFCFAKTYFPISCCVNCSNVFIREDPWYPEIPSQKVPLHLGLAMGPNVKLKKYFSKYEN